MIVGVRTPPDENHSSLSRGGCVLVDHASAPPRRSGGTPAGTQDTDTIQPHTHGGRYGGRGTLDDDIPVPDGTGKVAVGT